MTMSLRFQLLPSLKKGNSSSQRKKSASTTTACCSSHKTENNNECFLDDSSRTISTSHDHDHDSSSTLNDTFNLAETVSTAAPSSEQQDQVVVAVTSHNQERKTKKNKKSVTFGSLEINEHVVVIAIGQCLPSCGVPIGIGWERQTQYRLPSIIEYDDLKTYKPRRGEQMLLSKDHRQSILLEWGYTFTEVNRQTKLCDEFRRKEQQLKRESSIVKRLFSNLKRNHSK